MDLPRSRKRHRRAPYAILGALIVLGTVSLALRHWRNLPPTVDRASIQIGCVTRATFVRSVQGAGILEATEARWLSATHAGRIERLPLRPGAAVSEDTLVVEMSNSELELRCLEIDRELAAFRLERIRRSRDLAALVLNERSALTALVGEQQEAVRRWDAESPLWETGYIAKMDAQRVESRVAEMKERVQWAERRIELFERKGVAERTAEGEQLRALEQMARFRRSSMEALKVRAGVDGVLQSLQVEVGQWVAPGTVFGKVARPDALKAVLHIAEVQARDLALGQRATVDTRHGVVDGEVSLVAPTAHDGTVNIEIRLLGPLPTGARADARIDGTILLESLPDALVLPRPVQAQAYSRLTLFRIEGDCAVRTPVELGAANAAAFQVRAGADAGDHFILSDMSRWDGTNRLLLSPDLVPPRSSRPISRVFASSLGAVVLELAGLALRTPAAQSAAKSASN